MKDLLQTLLAGQISRELLLAGGLGIVIVLLLILLLWLKISRKPRASDIGLRRVETAFSNDLVSEDRHEPDADLEIPEEPSVDPLESAGTPITGTQVYERVFEPSPTTARTCPSNTTAVPVSGSEAICTEESAEPEQPMIYHRTPSWSFLETLPFRMRQGLKTAHADLIGISVEAVFFDPESINRLSDPVLRLVPFLPDGELLARESDRKTFRMGSLHAQPDAVIQTDSGLLSVEYKSRGGRSDDPSDISRSLRTQDLLQTLIEAMVLSTSQNRPVAPLLRTHNAVYFLRPERRIMKLLSENIVPAEDFLAPYSTQSGISASDYASLCAVAAERLFAAPVNEDRLAGEEAHRRLLG